MGARPRIVIVGARLITDTAEQWRAVAEEEAARRRTLERARASPVEESLPPVLH